MAEPSRAGSFSSKLRARLLGEGYLEEGHIEPAPPPTPPPVASRARQAPLFQRYDLIALVLGVLAFFAAARFLEYKQGKKQAKPPELR